MELFDRFIRIDRLINGPAVLTQLLNGIQPDQGLIFNDQKDACSFAGLMSFHDGATPITANSSSEYSLW